jgi:hypothetical protein
MVNTDRNCTAKFNLNKYMLKVSKNGTGKGTVTAIGIKCGVDCQQSYLHGTSLTLIATAVNGSMFAGWSGEGCSTGVLTVNGAMACTATFDTAPVLPDRIGVYRPNTGEWFLDQNGSGIWDNGLDTHVPAYTAAGAMPVIGDWSDMGVSQLGMFQPSTLQWHLDLNNNKAVDACDTDGCEGPFGEANDIAIAGKWDAKANERVGVFRPSTGYWYFDRNANGDFNGCTKDRCARLKNYVSGDLPVVGDWSGNGVSQLGLFRPSTGEWFLDRNANRVWDNCKRDLCITSFGGAGDLPVSGDWNATGQSKIGIFRPSTGEWFLDLNGNGVWEGCAVDLCVAEFGAVGDIPVVGKW